MNLAAYWMNTPPNGKKNRVLPAATARNQEALTKDPKAEVNTFVIPVNQPIRSNFHQSVHRFYWFYSGYAACGTLGILCGMSETFRTALNPLIQIF